MLTRKPLSWFKIDKNQPRKSFNEAEDRALGESMQRLGQLQPTGAMADGTLLWGERRYRAAQFVGINELSVIITDKRAVGHGDSHHPTQRELAPFQFDRLARSTWR